MKKVLWLDYFFPPLIPHWRCLAFARLLPEFGWKPIVISADERVTYDKDYSPLQYVPVDTPVTRVGHREPSKTWQYARNRLGLVADFPDYYKTWYRPACLEARKILQRESIDLIYSASPSFTAAFVAMQMKKEFGLPWIADFLDGWAVNDFLLRSLEASLLRPLYQLHYSRLRRGEQRILRLADRTVVVSWHVKERFCTLHGVDEKDITVITDGYDESVFQELTPRRACANRITITFLGSFYPAYEDPIRTFLEVIHEIDPRLEVEFIGRAAMPVYAMNQPHVTCTLNIPREKALGHGLGSDFLFIVMPEFAKWIPAKIYEYLRLGKPILALVPQEGDAARIVREAKAGYILPFDRVEMKRELEKILSQQEKGQLESFKPNRAYINQFERRQITEQMVRVFNEVIG